jgi:hypothetical protein
MVKEMRRDGDGEGDEISEGRWIPRDSQCPLRHEGTNRILCDFKFRILFVIRELLMAQGSSVLC